ncbi:MAG: hypothetical protein ACK5XA_08680 [Tagaea sp.]
MKYVYAVIGGASVAHLALTVYQNPGGAWILGWVFAAAAAFLFLTRA